MGMPQKEETAKPKVHANTGCNHVKRPDRYLDDDRREIARETWQDMLEMIQDAVKSLDTPP